MESVSKTCQNCKKDFQIEPEDFNFYEKVKVPAPTFCPQCRLIRRLSATNERKLYKRNCDFSGKEIFSMYDNGTPFPVYELDVWNSDVWDPYQYGMDYDPNRPFFEQYKELLDKTPRFSLVKQGFSTNSPYTHRIHDAKNSYMVFRMTYSDDSFYSYVGRNIKDSSDCLSTWDCELCYECIDCNNSFKLRFSQECHDCRDSFFLYACRNCSDCVGCVNSINQSYCIFNKKYEKGEYFKKLNKLKLNTHTGLQNFKKEFKEFKKKFPFKAIHTLKSHNYSGNWIVNCQNVKNSFGCLNVKDGKFLIWITNSEECMDYFEWGNKAELVYESANCGINIARVKFSNQCWMGATDIEYCHSCPGAKDCFGCVSLRKGEYSILNKKYTKDEYLKLREKIITDMKTTPYIDGSLKYFYGENLPESFTDFAYNETAAGDFFPLSKEEALNRGYRWKDKEKRDYAPAMKSSDLPETIAEVQDSITNEVIECGEKDSPYSVGAYRITQNELSFYRKMNLPLPRVSFDVRHMHRFAKRPSLKIIKRHCSKCNTEVETVYTEEYTPIIYCEKCYQQEVY